MPVDYYPQKGTAELLTMLDSLQKRATTGVVYFTTATGGMQQQRTFQGAARVEVEIRRVLYSLYLREPENFSNPYVARIRKVLPSYRGLSG